VYQISSKYIKNCDVQNEMFTAQFKAMPAAMKQVGQIAADRTRNLNNFTCARDRYMYDMSLERELKNLQE
jgi:hypothetical protein